MTILPQLRDALVHARPRRRRRPFFVGLLATGGLAVTGAALAATGVLQLPPVGDPVEPTRVERNPERGVGVPTDQAGRLLALRVPDPAGGPPWGLRIVDTTRGMQCLQAGRVVGDQLGVLGQDGIAGDDGRFHPLPPATRSGWVTQCQLPDANGRFFIAIDKLSYASGDADPRERACREPSNRDPDKPRCPTADARRIAFGLLGPEASTVTFADGSTQVPTEGDGAYLHVSADGTEQGEVVIGGGPVPGLPVSAVKRIDYRDGTHCPTAGQRTPSCMPKGYVEPAPVPSSKSLRRNVSVKTARDGKATWIKVRFRAPASITDAGHEYRLLGQVPDSADKRCRGVVMYVPSNRNIARGDTVKLEGIVPDDCQGRLVVSVVLAATTERNDGGKLIGRVTRPIAP
ncbi:hypothetical protein OJ998_17520 [Solirubrobacter taibaiensis]|nr:hypothetical protein [Solirubrobacter taibaiensis]